MKNSEAQFQTDLDLAVRNVFQKQISPESVAALEHARQYLLEELAFLLAVKQMFNESAFSYLYHRPWPIFERLVNGDYSRKLEERIGFLELRMENMCI